MLVALLSILRRRAALSVWRRAIVTPDRLPAFARSAPLLVGRDRELALLREHLSAALAGRGSLVLIGGEAGVGKTALAETVCQKASERGALVLVGHCYDLAETPPYGAWIDLIARYPLADDAPPLPQAFAQRGTVGTVANQMALFIQVSDFLTAVSSQRPLVLFLDDLHWADQASLDLLRFVARSVTNLPLMILATYRVDEITRRHPLTALLPALVREARATRLDLHRLDRSQVGTLVQQHYPLGEADAAMLTTYLAARTEGNPFFIGEMLRALEEDAVLTVTQDGWRLGDLAGTGLPTLLRQVIEGRLTRLDLETQRLLAVAAVIGQEVPFNVWTAVVDQDEAALLEAVEQAMAAHLVDAIADGSGFRFLHALIREALYEGIVPMRRRVMHRQIADVLVAPPNPDADAVAYHYRQAGDDRAAEWLIHAGERAAHAYAYETAAARFEEAVVLLEGDAEQRIVRAELLLALARLRRFTPQAITYAEEAMRLATEAGDEALTAAAQFRLGNNRYFAQERRLGLDTMQAAIMAFDRLPTDVTIRFVRFDDLVDTVAMRDSSYASRLATVGRFAEAERYGERALREEQRSGVRNPETTLALMHTYAGLGRPDDALAMAFANPERWLARHEFGTAAGQVQGALWRVILPYFADQPGVGEELTRRIEEGFRRVLGETADVSIAPLRNPLRYVRGHWEEVQPVRAFSNDPGSGAWVEQRFYAMMLTEIVSARGESETAWKLVRQLVPGGPTTEPGNVGYSILVRMHPLAANLALASGDLATAKAWIEAYDRLLAFSSAILGLSEGQALWARYYRAIGDTEQAQAHAERALVHASEPRQPLALLAAHRLLGELATEAARYDEAEQHLDASLALANACAAPYERALTHLARVEWFIATGQHTEATVVLNEVRAICEPLGAKPALARADALAARLPRRRETRTAYPDGLSRREVEVLRLIAAGMSNREIADALSISVRTVERHVENVYRKIDVHNKVDASAYVFAHQIQ